MASSSPPEKALKMSKPKVAIVGAAGGIGQPLSLLLKLSPLVGELAVIDIVGTPGIAADLSHIDTSATVIGNEGADDMSQALRNADVVLCIAGRAQKPGMSRDDLFAFNARIVEGIAKQCAEVCPSAMICVVTNPVNAAVPIFSEVLKSAGCYDPRRIFGINTLDWVRARTFVAELKGLSVDDVTVPIVGGHSGPSILPLLSRTKPPMTFTAEEIESMTFKIQDAANVVINLKAGKGSSTLSIAYSTCHFATQLLEAMNGKPDVVETAYVKSEELPDVPYLATPLLLGVSVKCIVKGT